MPSLAWLRKIRLLDILLLLAVTGLLLLLVGSYISRERFFYYWDWGGYQAVAIDHALDFARSPLKTLLQIKDSIALEYNHYFTLPLIPLILAFGNSRLSYILSLTLVYQIPYALVIGGIATKLIPYSPQAVFWSGVLLALITPAALAPTLRAYPDVGAATLIGLAIFVYLQDIRLGKWWQVVAIGVLIGAAILFRRHFTYDGSAFYATLLTQAIIGFGIAGREYPRQRWRDLVSIAVRIGLAGIMTILTILIFGKPFLINVVTSNYGALLSSYTLASRQVLDYFISNYGWALLALAALGYLLGWMRRLLNRPVAGFLILFAMISILQWMIFVRQISVHYTLHFTLPVVLGILAFFWTIWLNAGGYRRALIILIGAGFLLANLFVSLDPVHIDPGLSPWISYRYPPLYRSDYDEVVKLVEFLRGSVPEGAPIYVVDSSDKMNFDLLLKAEQVLHDKPGLTILVTPQIDSRDFYPLELLLQADYAIVSSPVQYHLSNPEEQKVVAVVHQAFTQNWKIAQDFSRLPEEFNLAGDVVLNIYRRMKPTSLETAVQSLHAMRNWIGPRPGSQPDWIRLNPEANLQVNQSGENAWRFKVKLNQLAGEPGLQLLYADPAPARGTITGEWIPIGKGCPPGIVGIKIIAPDGGEIDRQESTLDSAAGVWQFQLDFESPQTGYLVFYLESFTENKAEQACAVRLDWALQQAIE